MQTDNLIQLKYKKILPFLNERQTRIVLAADAESMGRGGLSKVSKLSGISRVTLNMGIKELALLSTNEVVRAQCCGNQHGYNIACGHRCPGLKGRNKGEDHRQGPK